MFKRFFIIFTVVFMLTPSAELYADLVIGNDFLYQHEDETQKLDRSRFCVNGPDGYVVSKIKPGSNEDVLTRQLTYKNGEEIIMDYTYILEGEYWGVTSSSFTGYPGWIPMDYLLAVYAPDDFRNEHEDDFYTYTGGYDAIFAAERLVLWQWPGSDREKRVFDDSRFILNDVESLRAYKDKEGREWGYVRIEYKYEHEVYARQIESWICLSEPANSNIPSFYPSPEPVKWSPDGIYEWTHTNVPDDAADKQYLLSNITKVRTYEPNKTFKDVQEDAWYRDPIATAYEYDIINGKGDNVFDRYSYLTGVEAITIAARIHAYYKYGKEDGDKIINAYNREYNGRYYWWGGVVQYCKAENLIRGEEFDNSETPLTRAQMVHAWVNILQPKDMLKQNTVVKLPDVGEDTTYAADIILFYEAGILCGVDAKGTFNPNLKITRPEAAAIFMNIIDINKRQNGRTYKN